MIKKQNVLNEKEMIESVLIIGVNKMVFEDYLKGVYKSKGGIIRSFVRVDKGIITDITFSGDFFLLPEDAIDLIIQRLIGTDTEKDSIQYVVEEVYKTEKIQSPGTTPEDFTRSIMQAIGGT
jgi:lipoate-protein ligase A